MVDPGVRAFVLQSLPPPPVRVLEVGAGDGELAEALGSAGYDVLAIDPASRTSAVRGVPLHELSEPPGSFDAAVAVVSMHHVAPLAESCRRLGEPATGPPRYVRLTDRLTEEHDDRARSRPLERAEHP